MLDYRIQIRENESLEYVIDGIGHSFNHLLDEGRIQSGIAIGAHGITDYITGKIIHAPHFQSWGKNVDLRGMLSQALNIEAPIYVDNQIRFQVLAEKEKGIAKTKKRLTVRE